MLRNAIWVLMLGIIVAYLFFLGLGAFSVGEAIGASIVVAVMTVVWLVHAILDSRREHDHRDPRLVHARERRGF
jgi:hypothetical protein